MFFLLYDITFTIPYNTTQTTTSLLTLYNYYVAYNTTKQLNKKPRHIETD